MIVEVVPTQDVVLTGAQAAALDATAHKARSAVWPWQAAARAALADQARQHLHRIHQPGHATRRGQRRRGHRLLARRDQTRRQLSAELN
jgi:hypothetical protein